LRKKLKGLAWAERRREISLEGITGVSVTDGDSRHTIVIGRPMGLIVHVA